MKKILSVSVVIIVLSFIFSGCDKSEPPPPLIQPKVELTVTPEGILPYGAYCTISWTSTDAKSILLNNNYVSLSGSVSSRLFKDTIFEAIARNESLVATAKKEIDVGDWRSSVIGLITYHAWKDKSVRAYRDETLLTDYLISQKEKDEIYFFHLDGKFIVYRYGEKIGDDVWSLSSDEKFFSMGKNPPWVGIILRLTEAEMTLAREQLYADGLPCVLEWTVERI